MAGYKGTRFWTGLSSIPPPCCLREFPFVFVLGFVVRLFHWRLCHRDNLAGFAVLRMKARPLFHLRNGVCNETITCIETTCILSKPLCWL